MQTIIKKINVYEFEELTQKAKNRAIEDVRDDEHRLGDWWSESIIEDFVNELTSEGWGLDPTDVHFSGFCSQGDGASFDAQLDVYTWLKANKFISKYPTVAKWAKEGQILGKTHTNHFSNHYCHENTRFFELETDLFNKNTEKLDQEICKLEEHIELDRLTLCQKLYRELETTYSYLMSEEAIVEEIKANGYTYLINKNPFNG